MDKAEITLEGLSAIYEYVKDKDMTEGSGLTVAYSEEGAIVFSVTTVAPGFAESVMCDEIKKILDCPVTVTSLKAGEAMGVNITLAPDKDKLFQLLTVDSNLEQLRAALGPDLGYQLSKSVTNLMLERRKG